MRDLDKRGCDRERILAGHGALNSRQGLRVVEGFGAMTLASSVDLRGVETAGRIRDDGEGVAKPALTGD